MSDCCPYCGAEQAKGHLRLQWMCGTVKSGEVPYRHDHCCIRELEQRNEKLESLMVKLIEGFKGEACCYCNHFYNTRSRKSPMCETCEIYAEIHALALDKEPGDDDSRTD